MFEAENIRDWRGHDVVDVAGARIGELEAIYVDTASDVASFASVRTGLPGRRRLVFVPLTGAKVSPRHLKVAYKKAVVKRSPWIGTDDELLADDEVPLFEHYGLEHASGNNGRRLARR
ncbi:MAG: PRC-barrel domain-containing protein [Acidimicrobiales bacterium]